MKTPMWTKCVSAVLIVTFTLLVVAPSVNAFHIPSSHRISGSDLHAADLSTIQKALEIKKVQSRLEALGYSKEEITRRLTQLPDTEIHRLANHINSVTTAGDGIGAAIGVLVIIVLIIVILKLLNKEIIIK